MLEKKLKDRGNIKWTAMMLPEHVVILRELVEEQKKVPKPILDEQQLEEFEHIICEAMEHDLALTFVYWESGAYCTAIGNVKYMDAQNRKLRILDKFNELFIISFESLIDVRS